MNLTHTCRSIAIAGHRGDVGAVTSGLTHAEAEVRVVALSAAERAGILDLEILERALSDPTLEVRYRAVELVARCSFGVSFADRVIDTLTDPELSELSAFVLGELELTEPVLTRAVSALGQQALNHDDALARESAVAALGALGHGLPSILAATTDVATVRRRAILALAPFEGPEVDAALQSALEDRDWQVRQAAEDLLPPATEAPPEA